MAHLVGSTSCESPPLYHEILKLDEYPRYVDEAQDNLLIDALRESNVFFRTLSVTNHFTILVLRLLCRNADGLFWAGDTAQTISEGSSFRFNDLKSFMFRIEVSST